MLLVIDCGNTNVVFAVRNGASWRGIWRLRTEAQRTSDEYGVWLMTLLGHAGLKRDDSWQDRYFDPSDPSSKDEGVWFPGGSAS